MQKQPDNIVREILIHEQHDTIPLNKLNRNRHFPSRHTSFPFSSRFPFLFERLREGLSLKNICKVQMFILFNFSPPTASTWINIFPFHHLKSPAFSVIYNWPAWVFQRSSLARIAELQSRDKVVYIQIQIDLIPMKANGTGTERRRLLPTDSLICICFPRKLPIRKWRTKSLQLRVENFVDPNSRCFSTRLSRAFSLVPFLLLSDGSDDWVRTINLKSFERSFCKIPKTNHIFEFCSDTRMNGKGSMINPQTFACCAISSSSLQLREFFKLLSNPTKPNRKTVTNDCSSEFTLKHLRSENWILHSPGLWLLYRLEMRIDRKNISSASKGRSDKKGMSKM